MAQFGARTTTPGGLPRLELPRQDPRELAGLVQEQLAPTRAGLTRALQSVQAQRFGSPVARREAFRGALRGAGEGLAPAQAAATRTAFGLARPEFEARMQEAMARYRLQLEEAERKRIEKEQVRGLTRTDPEAEELVRVQLQPGSGYHYIPRSQVPTTATQFVGQAPLATIPSLPGPERTVDGRAISYQGTGGPDVFPEDWTG